MSTMMTNVKCTLRYCWKHSQMLCPHKWLLTHYCWCTGDSCDVEKHFTPKYNPWDQRFCLVPDGDLFKSIRDKKASVETGMCVYICVLSFPFYSPLLVSHDHTNTHSPHWVLYREWDPLDAWRKRRRRSWGRQSDPSWHYRHCNWVRPHARTTMFRINFTK